MTKLKPQGENINIEQIAEYDGHVFYMLDANPMYVNKRFFYYISKWEQISTLIIPNDYILAVVDTFEDLTPEQFAKEKTTLCNLIKFAVNNRSLNWYHTTIAIIESFIIVDDEPVNEISAKHNKIKRDVFLNHPEARFFFTNLAVEYIKKLPTDLKDTDFGDYLKKMNSIEPELIESIMKGLRSDPFGIFTKKP